MSSKNTDIISQAASDSFENRLTEASVASDSSRDLSQEEALAVDPECTDNLS